jgi:3-isopropylmalate dehydrogenase
MTTNRPYRLGVMPGDGIGPEIVPASVRVVDAALAAAGAEPVDWQELPLGATAIGTHGSAIPDSRWRRWPARRLAARPARQRRLPRAVPVAAQPERHAAQALRPVREHPPGARFEGGKAIAPTPTW